MSNTFSCVKVLSDDVALRLNYLMKNVHLSTLERPCRADKTDQSASFRRQGSSAVTLNHSYQTRQLVNWWSFSPVKVRIQSHTQKTVFFFFLFDKLQVSCPPGRNWLRQQNWKYLTSALSIAASTNGICVENKSVLLHILFASTPCGYWHLVWKYFELIWSIKKRHLNVPKNFCVVICTHIWVSPSWKI